MKRYLGLFLFLASWFGCFCQNPVDNGALSSTDVIHIDDALLVQCADPEFVSDALVETPEIIEESEGAETSIDTDIATMPVSFDYKETKYWKRYKKLRTAGWTCLGVGAGFFVGGYALIFAAFLSSDYHAFGIPGGILFFSSPLLVLASIPLLTTAYINRHKAKKMNLNVGVSQLTGYANGVAPYLSMRHPNTPAVSFSLEF